jgi:hypothetical protein
MPTKLASTARLSTSDRDTTLSSVRTADVLDQGGILLDDRRPCLTRGCKPSSPGSHRASSEQVETWLRSLRDGGPRVRPVVSQVLLVFWDFFPEAFRLVPGLNRYWRDWSERQDGTGRQSLGGWSVEFGPVPAVDVYRAAGSQSVGEGYRLPRAANDVYLWDGALTGLGNESHAVPA